jgi:cytochrome c
VINRVLCFIVLAAVLGTGAAITQEKKLFTADSHKERGLTCAACHKEEQPKAAASGDACLACHKSIEAVAERTKDLEKNPHKNHITDGSDVACTACHQGHKANISLCHQCHAGLTFEKKQAEAK